MPRLGCELTTLVLKGAKTVHALDRAATVIGTILSHTFKIDFGMAIDSGSNFTFRVFCVLIGSSDVLKTFSYEETSDPSTIFDHLSLKSRHALQVSHFAFSLTGSYCS
jgi:hypothetical protein